MWTSTAQVAEKLLILARTTPIDERKKPSQGLSLFYTDLDREQFQISKILKMGRATVDTNTLFYDGWKVPAEDVIGGEGNGFKLIMAGLNAELISLSAEAIGIGYTAIRQAANHAAERVVFGRSIGRIRPFHFYSAQLFNFMSLFPSRVFKSTQVVILLPTGQNQAIQHPLASSYIQLEAIRSLIATAARAYNADHNDPNLGALANSCKWMAGEMACTVRERAVMAHGEHGYAEEYHVERYLIEVLRPRIAPVVQEMCLNYVGERVLRLPRSYRRRIGAREYRNQKPSILSSESCKC